MNAGCIHAGKGDWQMKLIVFSDIHGASGNFARILAREPDAQGVLFLGDGYRGVEDALARCGLPVHAVCGNCDGDCGLPEEAELTAAGRRIFLTHGHRYHVKSGTQLLEAEGQRRGAEIVLFGHTHRALEAYRGGMYVLNPGAASGYGASYGKLDVRAEGVLFSVARL